MANHPRVLAVILAGGEGSRLGPLTEERAKPAVPFAGTYRLIDFPLSNCQHSRFQDVWIIQQYEPLSLEDHIVGGRPWDLDRNHGGLRILHPHTSEASEAGMLKGNGDALAKNARFLSEFDPDVIVVLSADHVYKMDYRPLVEKHLDDEADLTIVTATVEPAEASRFGVVEADGDRAISYEYKPETPKTTTVATEVFCFKPAALLAALEDVMNRGGGDLGDGVLPTLVEHGQARCFELGGPWRDVGTLEAYLGTHMELLDGTLELDLCDPDWPIRGLTWSLPPARVEEGSVRNSMLSPGVVVHGSVDRSVIGPNTIIEDGATVRDSVVLDHVKVRAGASVRDLVVDSHAEIGPETG